MSEKPEVEFKIEEATDFSVWCYKTYVKPTEKENLLKRRTPMIQLYKSDFDTTINYLVYLTIKAKRDDKKGTSNILI